MALANLGAPRLVRANLDSSADQVVPPGYEGKDQPGGEDCGVDQSAELVQNWLRQSGCMTSVLLDLFFPVWQWRNGWREEGPEGVGVNIK